MAIFTKTPWLFLGRKWPIFKTIWQISRLTRLADKRAFTLIELLVALAIISMIAGLGAANYMTSLKRGRDVRRTGDMKKVQQAFEQYYGANQRYDIDPTSCIDMTIGYYVGAFPPQDPSGATASCTVPPNETYGYCIVCQGSNPYYRACAKLENPTGNASDKAGTYVTPGTGNYFCVTSLQ